MKRTVHHGLVGLGCALALAACGDKTTTVQMRAAAANDKPTAGDKLTVTVSIVDAKGAPQSSYRGSIHFEGDDDGAQLPGDYTFNATDGGHHAFDIPVTRAGKHSLRLTDKADAKLQASVFYEVQAGATHLMVVSGDGQTGTVAKTLAKPLVVKATDAGGSPIPGLTVTWSVVAGGGGVFATPTTATAMDGTASVTFSLGQKMGPVMLTAQAGAVSAAFTATATPDQLAKLVVAAGDNQTGTADEALPMPLVVNAQDQYGNPIGGVSVSWSALDGGGSVASATATTAPDGTANTAATLGPTALVSTYQASAAGVSTPVKFTAQRKAFKLTYSDPAAGGKLRLVKNPTSTDSSVVLDLVVGAQSVTGYAAGFNLPIDASRAVLDPAAPITPGTALSPGTKPVAAKAVLPTSGPLTGVMVSAQSQKATGGGAVAGDTTLPASTVVYSVKLNLVPSGAVGVVFDGTVAGFKVPSGGLRDKLGTQVVNPADVAIGKLEVVK